MIGVLKQSIHVFLSSLQSELIQGVAQYGTILETSMGNYVFTCRAAHPPAAIIVFN